MSSKSNLIVVTGAGSGIGSAIAYRLAKDGFTIAAADINERSAEKVAEEIRENGGEAHAFYIDVTNKETIRNTLGQAITKFGSLAAWVSNAGVSSMNHFTDLTEDEWDLNFNVNTKGPFLCGQVAAEQLIEQGEGGVIVNTASMAGKRGSAPFLAHYVASKFAVVGLTQSMAFELADHGIRVNAICPGYVATPMQDRELEWEAKLRNSKPEAVKEMWIKETPLGRLETPEDLAGVVSFLISDDARFITGEAIAVNGGVFMD